MQYSHGDLSSQDIRKLIIGVNLSYSLGVGQVFNNSIEIVEISYNGRRSEKFGVQSYDVYVRSGNEKFLWKSISGHNIIAEFNINY